MMGTGSLNIALSLWNCMQSPENTILYNYSGSLPKGSNCEQLVIIALQETQQVYNEPKYVSLT